MSEVPIMVMPWHRPDPCKPLKMQTDAAFKASYLDYLATLRLDSPPASIPLTSIMGTIGPASDNVDVMVDLMQQGMSIALVPLALGTRQEHLDTIAHLRTANSAFNNMRNMVFPLGIAVQTKGPGLRLGGLVKDQPIMLNLHHKVTLTTDKAWRTKGSEHYLYIGFPEMENVLTEGDILLVGNGAVILQVEHVENKEAVCLVVGGGVIQSFTSVSVPDIPLELPPLTDEDIDDIRMAADMGVDIILASRTQTADLIKDIRKILEEEDNGTGIKIWAQIESNQALLNLEPILEVADAVVFSRISMTQDIPAEKLFIAQKIVLSTCNKAGVPVFVSSFFLPSMQVSTTPSIAEVFDVASAVLDGADGFLLRNIVSHGKHPELGVRTLTGICVEAEAAVWHHQTFSFLNAHAPPPIDPTHSIAIAAVEASLKSSATVILLATTSGRSAQLIARYRPRCPIIAITRYGQVARQLNTWRAIIPLHYVDPPLPEWTREVDVRLQYGIEFAKHKGIVNPGDCMVLLNGWRQGAGFTNTIRVVYASESFPWVYSHKLPDSIPSDKSVAEEEEAIPTETLSTAAGEPKATVRSGSMLKTSTSIRSPSLGSRVRSMEAEFKSMASSKSREMAEKMLESLQNLKSTQSANLQSMRSKSQRETSVSQEPSSLTEKRSTRPSEEYHAPSRKSTRAKSTRPQGENIEPATPSQQGSEKKQSVHQSVSPGTNEADNADTPSQLIQISSLEDKEKEGVSTEE